jgi:hypothetical protein
VVSAVQSGRGSPRKMIAGLIRKRRSSGMEHTALGRAGFTSRDVANSILHGPQFLRTCPQELFSARPRLSMSNGSYRTFSPEYFSVEP